MASSTIKIPDSIFLKKYFFEIKALKKKLTIYTFVPHKINAFLADFFSEPPKKLNWIIGYEIFPVFMYMIPFFVMHNCSDQ